MPLFRFDVNRDSGIVTLFTEHRCGMKPVFVWTELDGVKEFAEMLLNFYSDALLKENNKIKEVSEHILRQALEDNNGANDIQ
jgi:hypothetical protein